MATPGPIDRYLAAIHRLQTILKWTLAEHGYESKPGQAVPDHHEASPKHLRVGVKSAMASTEALAGVLFDKGVITQEEYSAALADAIEARADTHEIEVRARHPKLRFG